MKTLAKLFGQNNKERSDVTYQFKDVIPMEQEITNTKRQIDDIEWEGGFCPHLHKHLEHLISEYMNGEVFYPQF